LKLTIGYSPCPNDTFIFDAMINGKIPTNELEFEPVLEDVETLNQWAPEARLDITKLSFPALFDNSHLYDLLDSGAALGKGVGPLLISSSDKKWSIQEINAASIAIPGTHTTANLLLSFAFPQAMEKKAMVFSAIENSVLRGETDLGVIIHENRFTYQGRGLFKVLDLGEHWEQKMKVPIPLGCIAIRKNLAPKIKFSVESLVRESIRYAYSNYPEIPTYVRKNSQTMNEEVMRQHINLYVNNYSLSLGEEGRAAIEVLKRVKNGQYLYE
jgi:1,4-dihydroxy-6-naphthoate synthase